MKKLTAAIAAFLILIACAACTVENAVLEEIKTYEITSEIHSLDIQINAADFKIQQADGFSVESNLKYLSVSEKDGVLTIIDEAKSNSTYINPILTLYVPEGFVFNTVDIATGAAKLTADTLSADWVELDLGAGDVRFENLNAAVEADIQGGAGQITIASGTINDLSLEMGVGEMNLCAALRGNSNLEFGVGTYQLTLLGSKEDYRVEIEKGLGSITVDGTDVLGFDSIGNGQNHVEIEGGVGTIQIAFREA